MTASEDEVGVGFYDPTTGGGSFLHKSGTLDHPFPTHPHLVLVNVIPHGRMGAESAMGLDSMIAERIELPAFLKDTEATKFDWALARVTSQYNKIDVNHRDFAALVLEFESSTSRNATEADAVGAVSSANTEVSRAQVETSIEGLQKALGVARQRVIVARGEYTAAHTENLVAQKKSSKLKGGGKKAKADASMVLATAKKARDEAEKELREVEEIIHYRQLSGAGAIDLSSSTSSILTSSEAPVIPNPPNVAPSTAGDQLEETAILSTSTTRKTPVIPDPPSRSTGYSYKYIGLDRSHSSGAKRIAKRIHRRYPKSVSYRSEDTPGIPNLSAAATNTAGVQDSKTIVDLAKGAIPGNYTEIDEVAGTMNEASAESDEPKARLGAGFQDESMSSQEESRVTGTGDGVPGQGGNTAITMKGGGPMSGQKITAIVVTGGSGKRKADVIDDEPEGKTAAAKRKKKKKVRGHGSEENHTGSDNNDEKKEVEVKVKVEVRVRAKPMSSTNCQPTKKKSYSGKYKLNGVPMQRAASVRKSDGVPSPEGHLNCGCDIDVALADFIHWKTWTVTGIVDGEELTESLQDQHLQPRERLFVVKNFEKATKLKLGDLYTGNKNEKQFEKRKVEKQVMRYLEIFNKMREEDKEEKLELIVCDDSTEG
ncbi:hypothetical protein BD779DRAFT_1682495 [Infundibulicybe gibba]|nr:hypothetical protein BD779DRAFT_1682495 [Infundibulicybe gibba]